MKIRILLGALGGCLLICVIFVLMFSIRAFNAATTQYKIITPKDGVECLIVSTTDGASVDCWKT